jgi:predicted nucleic acid-binding protein
LIIDSDVLIWALNGKENAKNAILKNVPFNISVVNYMEIVQGMRNKNELNIFLKHLKKWSVHIIQIEPNISMRAMFLVEDYFLSNNMQLSDALIAATALEQKEILLTANVKHYEYIPNIQLSVFRP